MCAPQGRKTTAAHWWHVDVAWDWGAFCCVVFCFFKVSLMWTIFKVFSLNLL